MSDDKNNKQKSGFERKIQPPNTGKPRKTEAGGSRAGLKPITREKLPGDEITGEIPPWDDEENNL